MKIAGCPEGLPPDVEIGEIPDPSVIQGADGKLDFNLVDSALQNGDGDSGWRFEFTASNNTKEAPGYCITAIEVQLAVRYPDETIRKVTKRQTVDQTKFGPGASIQLIVDNVISAKAPELSSWKITRVWGFPVTVPTERKL